MQLYTFYQHYRAIKYALAALLLVLLVGGGWATWQYFQPSAVTCGEVKPTDVTGGSMQPLLHDGDKVLVHWGYYGCMPVERGDIAVFKLAARSDSIIKRVVAVPGDAVAVRTEQLFINNKLVKNSAGTAYFFPPEKTVWLLRGRDAAGRMTAGRYLLLADDTTNDYDSRRFGPVFIGQLVGKMVGMAEKE